MNTEMLDDLRARVLRKKQASEKHKLLEELHGKSEPIDKDAVYVSVKDVVKRSGLCSNTVKKYIKEGVIKARYASAGYRGTMYAIHPKDADEFISKYKKINFDKSGE